MARLLMKAEGQLDKSFGFLESGEDTHNVFTNIEAYLNYLSNVGVYAELHPWIHAAQAYLPKNGRIFLVSYPCDLDTASTDLPF